MSEPKGRPGLRINARLVKERDRARARELRVLLLYGALIVIPLLGYVWQRVDFIHLSYRLEELKRQRQVLADTNKQLTVERSLLLSPDRIESLARKRLGLADPLPGDVRRVVLIDGRIDEIGTQAAAAPEGASGTGLLATATGVGPRRTILEERR
jgi:cell division protein FtsL